MLAEDSDSDLHLHSENPPKAERSARGEGYCCGGGLLRVHRPVGNKGKVLEMPINEDGGIESCAGATV